MWKLQPPPFSNQLYYENSGPVKLSPLFENLVGGSALFIPSRKGGGGGEGWDHAMIDEWVWKNKQISTSKGLGKIIFQRFSVKVF